MLILYYALCYVTTQHDIKKASTCGVHIIKSIRRTLIDIPNKPRSATGLDLCCKQSSPYNHFESCKHHCGMNIGNKYNYVTDDILISITNGSTNLNGPPMCGIVNDKCNLQLMHWDNRCKKTINSFAYFDRLAVVPTVYYTKGNGHFMQETVPSWLRFLMYLPDVPIHFANTKLHVRFVKYLSMIGYNTTRFVSTQNLHVRAGTLYAWRPYPRWNGPSAKRPLTVRSYDDFMLLKDSLSPKYCSNVKPSLLYVLRSDKRSRSFENHESIRNVLANFSANSGLEFVQLLPGKMSVHADACEFNRARIVFAAHGAGLSNMIFCQTGTHIIEVGYKKNTPPIYHEQAHFMSLKYHAIIATKGGYDTSLMVSINHIHHTLSSFTY